MLATRSAICSETAHRRTQTKDPNRHKRLLHSYYMLQQDQSNEGVGPPPQKHSARKQMEMGYGSQWIVGRIITSYPKTQSAYVVRSAGVPRPSEQLQVIQELAWKCIEQAETVWELLEWLHTVSY